MEKNDPRSNDSAGDSGERVGEPATPVTGGRLDTIGEYTVNWAEQPDERPSCIPPNAPWCWVTDGLGRTVGAWAEVFNKSALGLVVRMFDPEDTSKPWTWYPNNNPAWASAEEPDSPSAALQCLTLWSRCVVDDKGRVWEMVWYFNAIKFISSADNWVLLLPVAKENWHRFCAGYITNPSQVAKVRTFIEAQKDSGAEPIPVNALTPEPERAENQDAAPTEADEQSSSVGSLSPEDLVELKELAAATEAEVDAALRAAGANPEQVGRGVKSAVQWAMRERDAARRAGETWAATAAERLATIDRLRAEAAYDGRDFQHTTQDPPPFEPEPPFARMPWTKESDTRWTIRIGEDKKHPWIVSLQRMQSGEWCIQVLGGAVLIHQSREYCIAWAGARLTDLTSALVGLVPHVPAFP